MKQNATPLDHKGFGHEPRPAFETRGVVLVPEDLTLHDWPERAYRAGLTTIALHQGNSPTAVICSVQSDEGQRFLKRCRQFGVQVEYELHAMKELLPRHLFSQDPTLFRANNKKERTPDANLCVHSQLEGATQSGREGPTRPLGLQPHPGGTKSGHASARRVLGVCAH